MNLAICKYFVIRDWANNDVFGDKTFNTFEDAYDFLHNFLEKKYPKIYDSDDGDSSFTDLIDSYWIRRVSL